LLDLVRLVTAQRSLHDEADEAGAVAPLALILLSGVEGVQLRSLLAPFALEAFDLGRRHGLEQLGLPVELEDTEELPRELANSVTQIDASLSDQVQKALVEMRHAETPDDVDHALAVAQRVESRVETSVVATVHQAVNAGTDVIVTEHDAKPVWLAERDACLHCLAYSGRVRGPGGFPQDATFAEKPLKPWRQPLLAPPRHPHCRCQLVAWNGVDGGGEGDPFPEALKREARRSVVKGWALPTEGVSARQKAAARLLARGADLPPSVEARARAAVRSKRFRTRPAP
jgi:hypothetical protein